MNTLEFHGLAGQLREQRKARLDAKVEGERVCNVYPYSCEQVADLVAPLNLSATEERDFRPAPPIWANDAKKLESWAKGVKGLVMCDCLKEIAACRKQEEADRDAMRKAVRFGVTLPERLQAVTFDKLRMPDYFSADAANNYQHAKKVCAAYATNPAKKPMLTLCGGKGRGKTTMAAAIANGVDLDVIWVDVVEMLAHLRSTFDAVGEFSYVPEFYRFQNAGLLVLDDLGKEKTTDWTAQELDSIISHRHMHLKPTVITTNLHMHKSTDRIGSRLRDVKCSQVVRMEEMPDFRLGGRR